MGAIHDRRLNAPGSTERARPACDRSSKRAAERLARWARSIRTPTPASRNEPRHRPAGIAASNASIHEPRRSTNSRSCRCLRTAHGRRGVDFQRECHQRWLRVVGYPCGFSTRDDRGVGCSWIGVATHRRCLRNDAGVVGRRPSCHRRRTTPTSRPLKGPRHDGLASGRSEAPTPRPAGAGGTGK